MKRADFRLKEQKNINAKKFYVFAVKLQYYFAVQSGFDQSDQAFVLNWR